MIEKLSVYAILTQKFSSRLFEVILGQNSEKVSVLKNVLTETNRERKQYLTPSAWGLRPKLDVRKIHFRGIRNKRRETLVIGVKIETLIIKP